MRKIFQERGGAIVGVVAAVALIALLGFSMRYDAAMTNNPDNTVGSSNDILESVPQTESYVVREFTSKTDRNQFAYINATNEHGLTIRINTDKSTRAAICLIGDGGIIRDFSVKQINSKFTYAVPAGTYIEAVQITPLGNNVTYTVSCDVKPNNSQSQKEIDATNYMLLVDHQYDDFVYNHQNGGFNKKAGYVSTQRVKVDKTQDIYVGSSATVAIMFYDENGDYINTESACYRSPLLKENIPENAVYVAFSYSKNGLLADKFYTSSIDNTFTPLVYSTIIKEKDTRPVINIKNSDSEEEIFLKLCDAWYTQDCDVYWETGEYSFDTIFGLMKTKYGWNSAYELPIGRNCRYYFNDSTLYATYTGEDSDVNRNMSLLGIRRIAAGNYELHDATLICENGVYVAHDDVGANEHSYTHKYQNLKMQYISGACSPYLAKCIGGGFSGFGTVIIDNCEFTMDELFDAKPKFGEVSYHGPKNGEEAALDITITNSKFAHTIHTNELQSNETATITFNNNHCSSIPSSAGNWTVNASNNTITE